MTDEQGVKLEALSRLVDEASIERTNVYRETERIRNRADKALIDAQVKLSTFISIVTQKP